MTAGTLRGRPAQPPVAKAVMAAVLVATPFVSLISPSSVVVGLCALALVIIIALLWRAEEPPILMLPALFQWSEVAAYPLTTLWKQVPLGDLSVYAADLDSSAMYGLAGVVALAAGLRLGSLARSGTAFADRLRLEGRYWTYRQVVRVGVSAIVLGYACGAIASIAGPAREVFGNAAGVKSVGIFLIAYWCLANSRHYGLLVPVMGFEVLFGMTGFFADFKNSILVLVVAVIAARPRLRLADAVAAGLVFGLLVFVATFWSAIKVEYRSMLNKGTGAQVVDIPLEDRVNFILKSLAGVDGEMLADGFDRLIGRHGYIEYLALVMQNVPYGIPHENGQLTMSVFSHITTPRFLFPDKPPLPSDTEVMAKYTGLQNTWDQNTSISIGNLGELYIDFGLVGGLIGEFCIGLLVAFVYRWLRDKDNCSSILSAGLCVMVALPTAYFGTAYIKLIGSFVFSSAIALLLQMYVMPRLAASQRLPIAGVSVRSTPI